MKLDEANAWHSLFVAHPRRAMLMAIALVSTAGASIFFVAFLTEKGKSFAGSSPPPSEISANSTQPDLQFSNYKKAKPIITIEQIDVSFNHNKNKLNITINNNSSDRIFIERTYLWAQATPQNVNCATSGGSIEEPIREEEIRFDPTAFSISSDKKMFAVPYKNKSNLKFKRISEAKIYQDMCSGVVRFDLNISTGFYIDPVKSFSLSLIIPKRLKAIYYRSGNYNQRNVLLVKDRKPNIININLPSFHEINASVTTSTGIEASRSLSQTDLTGNPLILE